MRGKRLLAAFLLGVGLCFVPGLGYGEDKEPIQIDVIEFKVPHIGFFLLQARVNYMMYNPTNFLNVSFQYYSSGIYDEGFPEHVDTKGKIYVEIRDNRGLFSGRSEIVLLELFKRELKGIYSFIPALPHYDLLGYMGEDIVAKFYSRGGIPLGYFGLHPCDWTD